MNNSKHLKKVLNNAISVVSGSPSLFVFNPETDFTRNRLLNFETVIKNIICMEAGSLKDELLKLDPSYASKSQSFVKYVQNGPKDNNTTEEVDITTDKNNQSNITE